MEGCVALVIVVGISQPGRVVVHDALDEEDVVEDDGPSKARRNVNPNFD